MGSLKTYREKRDPAKTPEPIPAGDPQPSGKASKKAPVFVIQEHHASALHWDLRLEHDGVLASWAVPKGIPMDPRRNHLAVQTEDHPIEYLTFHGEIPKGQYGAGTMTIWDTGTYELEKWRDSEVMVVLHGERVQGRYVLFKTGGKQWMLHRMDPAPTGWAPMPELVRPMLASPGALPSADGWSFEFKWDGVRAVARIDGGRVKLFSRNDRDISSSYPELNALGEELGSRQVILDGEVVALDDSGRPSFGALQPRMHITDAARARRLAATVPVTYIVFDLLHLDGDDLTALPYSQRREALDSLGLQGPSWQVAPSFDGNGEDVLAASRELGLEGVIAKKQSAPYRAGKRSSEWVKVKHTRTQEVVIGGWTPGKGNREGTLGALLMGVPIDDRSMAYAGKVGTGFDTAALANALELMTPLAQDENPFATAVPKADAAGATWITPTLVGEVEFTEWTGDNKLRHPTWRGWRPDKDASRVRREEQSDG